MRDFGKLMFIAGVILAVAGLFIWKTGNLGGFGQLPGDLSIRRPNFSLYFPITTCIVISIVLTIVMWLFRK